MMRDSDAFPRVTHFTSTFYLKLRVRLFPKCYCVPQNVPQHVPQMMFGELGNEMLFPKYIWGTRERNVIPQICLGNKGTKLVPQIWGTCSRMFPVTCHPEHYYWKILLSHSDHSFNLDIRKVFKLNMHRKISQGTRFVYRPIMLAHLMHLDKFTQL